MSCFLIISCIHICWFCKTFLSKVLYVNQQLDNHAIESLKSYYATELILPILFFFSFAFTKLLVHNFINALPSRPSQFSLYGAILTVPQVSLFWLLSLFHKLEFYRDWALLMIVCGAQVVAFVCFNKCHFCVRVNSCFFLHDLQWVESATTKSFI